VSGPEITPAHLLAGDNPAREARSAGA
jgi:hypothetical protein